ncbi:MAG TPA: LpqB family beta-propeller domain-containing protein, partial [Marmoricola sp.]|nr:LpqB family beta-propeller domain-containing protein [Marmoricola sp.]
TVTAFAPRTGLDLSVVVSDDGVAEVPLGPEIQRLSPADLYRAVVQLAWTLRQVPGVTRLRITVGGASVPLYNGQTEVSVNIGTDYDPVAASGRDVLTLTGGKLVHGVGAVAKAVGGPFGATGFALRSVAQSVAKHEYAAVATNGHRLYLAPDAGSTSAAKVVTVLDGATDLLRPAFDRFGGLWAIDETKAGAVVHLITGGHDHVVGVPGISGHRVTAFTVTRDGASLVAGLASGPSPTLVVSSLLRSSNGRLLQARAGRQTVVEASDHGPVVDLSQNSATTVAVLTGASAGNGQVISVELDGSPGVSPTTSPDPLPGQLVSLAASPDPSLPLRVVTADGKLMELTEAGNWIRIASSVTAASYPQ